MGCNQSKIENEEAVSRCKERKHHMKQAVSARNAFAAAHSAYAMALKNTGAALNDYAPGESSLLPPNHHPSHPLMEEFYPPPPIPNFPSPSPSPLSRASTMPQFSIPKPFPPSSLVDTIPEDELHDEIDADKLIRKTRVDNDDGIKPPPPPSPSREAGTPLPPPPPMPAGGSDQSSWEEFIFSHRDNTPGPSSGPVGEEDKGDGGISGGIGEKVGETSRVDGMKEEIPEQPSPVIAKGAKKGRQTVRPGLTLVDVFSDMDDHFLKASENSHEVSFMLEANRLHYHSNFADNRGHINHSARLMRVITWNRSFKGLQNRDEDDDFDSEEDETHATVLDKLLAWEKKLYDEVKAGELMKFEYRRKVRVLNKERKRGGSNPKALEKAKAAVSHLHTRYIVDMQSLDATVMEINRLRDHQLYPKLVALVDGLANAWASMQEHHEQQAKIATALRSLDCTNGPRETSEHHHERTIQLWAVVQEWCTQLEKQILHQKEYIKSLNSWLKLNLIPIESSLKEKVSSPPRPHTPPIHPLIHAWESCLEKLPDEGAKSAVQNFGAVINTIVQHQEEEMKLRTKCEDSRKELSRKIRQYEEWFEKHRRRAAIEGEEVAAEQGGGVTVDEAVAERQAVVETVRKRLEEEEEEYKKQCIHVRDKSITSLKTRLPDVFWALSEFSLACSVAYSNLRSISQQHIPS